MVRKGHEEDIPMRQLRVSYIDREDLLYIIWSICCHTLVFDGNTRNKKIKPSGSPGAAKAIINIVTAMVNILKLDRHWMSIGRHSITNLKLETEI